jgi:signal transduction histidine kinase
VEKQKRQRALILGAAIIAVSSLHYVTSIQHFWLHELFQRGYYIPVILAALWFGWRGGLLAALFSGVLYSPHILLDWGSFPGYSAHHIEVVMFFAVGIMCGVLADQNKKEHAKLEETARRLNIVNQQLQASFEHLRRADRLSALGELSAGLAHELRNPLGSIEGSLQILRRVELPESTRREFGDMAQKEVNRLKDLVSNFLDFARPSRPRRKPTDVGALLDSVRMLADEAARMAGVRIRLPATGSVPAAAIDPDQVKQVLLNLVLNAIQAMPNDGEVTLEAVQKNGRLEIRVRDEGVGIEPENLEKIFDPFFTTRADGTGLGLSVAYQIISQHGGDIAASRNPDKGMTFVVTLPLQEEPLAVNAAAGERI